jgi:hypothetical protein
MVDTSKLASAVDSEPRGTDRIDNRYEYIGTSHIVMLSTLLGPDGRNKGVGSKLMTQRKNFKI